MSFSTSFSFKSVTFCDSVISDEDWPNVQSEAFMLKFMKHEMPIVRQLATNYKDMVEAMQRAQQVEAEGEQESGSENGDNENGEDKPAVMPSFSDLAASNYWHWFNAFSSPDKTTWDSRNQLLTHQGGASNDGDYASCTVPLPADKVSSWDVKVDQVKEDLVLGIVHTSDLSSHFQEVASSNAKSSSKKKTTAPSVPSYSVENSAGWGLRDARVYNPTAKAAAESKGWPGWQVGDRGKFSYDPLNHKLSLFLQRTQQTYSVDTDPKQRAHLHCFFRGSGKVDFTSD